MAIKICDASYHRNGIGGVGFTAILFDDDENGRRGVCAVYKVDELVKGNIAFANGNSWRGDQFEAALRPALEEFLKAKGTNRCGPFGMPDTVPAGVPVTPYDDFSGKTE